MEESTQINEKYNITRWVLAVGIVLGIVGILFAAASSQNSNTITLMNGGTDSHSGQLSSSTPPTAPLPSSSSGTLCNGKYWGACPKEQSFVCPPSGDAYCEEPQQFQQNTVASNPTDVSQITAADIAPYLTGVVEILCKRTDAYGVEQINDTGSGSLWAFPDGTYSVVTNAHVIAGDDRCILWIPNPDGAQKGAYYLDLSHVKTWNSISDEAVVPILSSLPSGNPEGVGKYNIPISQLNYEISSLQSCPSDMPQGSPVTVVGYPAFSSIDDQGNPLGAFKNQITTNGIISGYTSPPTSGLPSSNYYISATIDSGNSGGVAFAKDSRGLCLLGIPTWVTTGNYANAGVVQNIRNVIWSGK